MANSSNQLSGISDQKTAAAISRIAPFGSPKLRVGGYRSLAAHIGMQRSVTRERRTVSDHDVSDF
jgi:hypothetical protein